MKHRLLTTLLISAAGVITAAAAPDAPAARDTISDRNPIYPESFETDVHEMMRNWYLTNYAVLDKPSQSTSAADTPDEVFIERLQAMPTVIEMPFNSIVRSFIRMYVDRKPQLVENMLGMSLYYMPIFEQALDRHDMPMELKYLPVIESALNPSAVSKAGATGLWQFMLPTATGQGLEVNSIVDERRDPYTSSDAAVRYLKQLYRTYGDWSLAIAAYNCGPGNVNKALRRAGGGKKDFWEIYPFLPPETRGYVPAFIAANYVMNYYHKHNISPALAKKPILIDTVKVNKRVHFQQIADVMGLPVDELRILNPQYRKDIIPGDIRPYSLALPSLQTYCYIANEDSIVNHNAELYARRDVVEPSDGSVRSQDSKGEYVEELVVKYHKVRRGETLASIARKYGVSASSIRKANGIGRKVRRGQRLKINTYTRRYIERAPEVTDSVSAAPVDSTAVAAPVAPAPADTTAATGAKNENTAAESSRVKDAFSQSRRSDRADRRQNAGNDSGKAGKKDSASRQSNGKEKASSTTHTIARGENLSKIARRYGVSVEDIKKANNMTNDNIAAGDKIKIPSKSLTGNKASKSKKRRRR